MNSQANIDTKTSEDFSQTQLKPVIKSVIFDVDGTLLDTEDIASYAIETILKPFKENVKISWELKSRIVGLRGPEWTKIVLEEFNLTDFITTDLLLTKWIELMHELASSMQLMPGAEKLVTKFFNMKIPMAIATSSTYHSFNHKRIFHPAVFEKFSVIVCGDDSEVMKGKPHPDIYLCAAARLKMRPSECLVFEDALSGVIAATAAGMHCIAVPSTRVDFNPFKNLTPYSILTSLDDFNSEDWNFCPSIG